MAVEDEGPMSEQVSETIPSAQGALENTRYMDTEKDYEEESELSYGAVKEIHDSHFNKSSERRHVARKPTESESDPEKSSARREAASAGRRQSTTPGQMEIMSQKHDTSGLNQSLAYEHLVSHEKADSVAIAKPTLSSDIPASEEDSIGKLR